MSSPENRSARRVRILLWIAVIGLAAITLYALKLAGRFDRPAHIAFVVGSDDPFFHIATAGARDAADSFGAKLEVLVPQNTDDQDRLLRELVDRRVDGICISPMNPARQAALLRDAAAATRLITFDADAPVSQRLCYVGTDNYGAGRLCGQLMKEALPNGGKIMISVGTLDADNGQRRRQGVIDELLDRSYGPGRPSEPLDAVLSGPKYTILGTLVDADSRESARGLVAAAAQAHPDLAGLIGLYAYNGPAIVDGLKAANRLGSIKVVAFDYDEDTLAGIEAGHIEATVVQDPYAYGYRAVAIVAELKRGESGLPMFQTLLFDCRPVRKDGIEELRATLKQQLHRGRGG